MSSELTAEQEEVLREELEEAGDDAIVLVEGADGDEPSFIVLERDQRLGSRIARLLAERGHDGGAVVVDRRDPFDDERGAELLENLKASLPPPVSEKRRSRKGKPSRFRWAPRAKGKRPNR